MRIITGRLKGKRFDAPKNYAGRPTTDYARESLFNILQNRFDFYDIKVLDLFSGTGAFSYECYSRGSEIITSVESDAAASAFIKSNFKLMGMHRANSLKYDAFKFIQTCKEKFDLVLADPPYGHGRLHEIPTLVFENKLLSPAGWLVLEHDSTHNFAENANFKEQRVYGNVRFSIFTHKEE